VASQSPSIEALPAGQLPGGLADPRRYLEGWTALSVLIERGYSWSGNERNCAFLNRGAEGFVEVSAISGLDFDDDGRSCTATDLDGDGDVDLVLKNRSGPQLRLLRNGLGSGDSVLVRLRDHRGNRDAIGARVELTAGSRRLVRCVSAGDGYLGQASRWLHFGLDGVPPIERLLVRWPDGSREEFAAPAGRGRYLAVRGKGRLELQGPLRPNGQPLPPLPALPPLPPLPAAEAVVLREPPPLPPLPDAEAVVLREPLPLPPTLSRAAFRGQPKRPVLLALWSRTCERCAAQVTALARQHAALRRTAVDVVFLGLHEASGQAQAALRFAELLAGHDGARTVLRQRPASADARKAFSALLTTVVGRDTLTPPIALLVDQQARVQVVYLGDLAADVLTRHVARFGQGDLPGPLRTDRGGRWAFTVQRSLAPLAGALERSGLVRDAAFFAAL